MARWPTGICSCESRSHEAGCAFRNIVGVDMGVERDLVVRISETSEANISTGRALSDSPVCSMRNARPNRVTWVQISMRVVKKPLAT